MKGDRPNALILHLDPEGLALEDDVRHALALCLFEGGGLSVGRAARVAQLDVASFIAYLSRRGVSIVASDAADEEADLESLEAWLASSLHNPRYAGAFAYGRRRTEKRPDGGSRVVKREREKWHALVLDAHEGYISFDDFERNERRLHQSRSAQPEVAPA